MPIFPGLPMNRSLRAITLALSLALLLALGGCSTGLKLAYNNLERLALWEVDDEIDLDDAQKAAFQQEFRALHRWHRQTQLPLYAAGLRALAAAIDRDETLGAAVTKTLAAADGHGEKLWEQARPGVERLFATLSDRQIADYDAEQRKDIDKESRKHADDTPDDRRKRWLRDWRNSLDRWIGKPNAQQTALLDAAWESEAPMLRTPAERAAVRLASHQRFIAGLATRAEPGLFARLIAGSDASEKTRSDALQARERALLATLFDAADATQRGKLKATLIELADDFESLAAKGASVAAATP